MDARPGGPALSEVGTNEWPDKAIDIGGEHRIQFFTYDEVNHPDAPNPAGIIEWHRKPDGTLCGGGVNFWRPAGDEGPTWVVEVADPLTLSPSILCSPEKGGCGSHGFIREGRWVGA